MIEKVGGSRVTGGGVKWSLFALLVLPMLISIAPREAFSQTAEQPPYVPDQILIKPKPNATDQDLMQIEGINGPGKERTIPGTRIEVVEVPAGSNVEEAIGTYEASPDVESAVPDTKMYLDQSNSANSARTPDDPDFGLLHGLHNAGETGGTTDADIDAPEAWGVNAGAPEDVVALLDTGVDVTHPDLDDNIWKNPDEIPDNGTDDDANGYVDDVHGWDFVNGDNSLYDEYDDESHGTHVAGIIAAEGNNAIGTTGVTWKAKVMPLKIVGPTGTSVSRVIAALRYATSEGIKVSNNSYGCYQSTPTSPCSNPYLLEELIKVDAAGHLFVASAGNGNKDTDVVAHYPSGYDSPNVVSVAATDKNDALWRDPDNGDASSYGASSVDLAAPGGDIYSTVPYFFDYKSGTSMAAPHVTGVAALLRNQFPTLGHVQVKDQILRSVDKKDSLLGKTATGGRLNAASALAAAPAPPSDTIRPEVVSTSPGTNSEGISQRANVEAVFSEGMDPSTLHGATFSIAETLAGGQTAADVSYDPASKKAVLDPVADLRPGAAYTATVKGGSGGAKDGAGNALAADKVWSFKVLGHPETSIASGPDGRTGSASASFSFASDQEGATFECALDAGAFEPCTSPKDYPFLANGDHTFEVRAVGRTGLKDATPARRSWTADASAPTVTVVAPANGAQSVVGDANAEATFSEEMDPATLSGATFTLLRQGATAPVTAAVRYDGATKKAILDPEVALQPGYAYEARVKGGANGAKDRTGNAMAADEVWSFTVEVIEHPNTDITSVPQTETVGPYDAKFSFASDQGDATFGCALDGAAFEPCTSPKQYSALTEGPHEFAVRAVGRTGLRDLTPAKYGFTVDATPPYVTAPFYKLAGPSTLPGTQPTLGTTTVPIIVSLQHNCPVTVPRDYACEEGAYHEIQKSVNGGPYEPVSLASPTAIEHRISVAPDAVYKFRARGRDEAGNWSAWKYGPSTELKAYQETDAAISYVGTWGNQLLSGAFGERVKYAGASGASAKLTFSGSRVAFVTTRGPNRGKADVLVDGVRVTTLDLYSATTTTRRVVIDDQHLDPSRSHTMTIRPLGTKNANSTLDRVDVDAFLVMRDQ